MKTKFRNALTALPALLAREKALREALEPFAAKADLVSDEYDEDYCPDWSPFIPVGAYRNARAALKETDHDK